MLRKTFLVCALLISALTFPARADDTSALVQGYTCASVAEGSTFVQTLNFSKVISSSTEYLFVRINKDNESDLIQCYRHDDNPSTKCEVQKSRFQSKGLVHDQLIIISQNATRDLQGLYVLHVAFNNTPYPPVNCRFTVLETVDTGGEGKSNKNDLTKVLVPLFVVILGLAILIACYCRRKQGVSCRCTCVEQWRNAFKNRTTDGRTDPEKSQRGSETDDDLHQDQLLLDSSKEEVGTFGDKDKERDNDTSHTERKQRRFEARVSHQEEAPRRNSQKEICNDEESNHSKSDIERMTGNEIELVSTEKTSEHPSPLRVIPYGAKSTCGEQKPIPKEKLKSARRKLHSPNTPKTPTKQQEKRWWSVRRGSF